MRPLLYAREPKMPLLAAFVVDPSFCSFSLSQRQ